MSGIEGLRGDSHADLRLAARHTAAWLGERGTMVCDAVVLVPYAQLMPQARQAWIDEVAGGHGCLLPRFLSTRQWASDMRALFGRADAQPGWSPQASIAHAHARRMLAQTGLDRAFDGRATASLVELLLGAAQALVPLVQALDPSLREKWLQDMRSQRVWGFDAPGYDADAVDRSRADVIEPALLRIALEWVGMTRFETDVLWDRAVRAMTPALVVWQGLQTDGLPEALAGAWGDAALVLPWPESAPPQRLGDRVQTAEVRLFAANDAEQEACWAAACVIRHLQAGARRVGVAALDRALARRVRAMLAARGVTVLDETGWKLSTTHAATQLMAWLTAARRQASTHEVLDAARGASQLAPQALRLLESRLVLARYFQWPAAEFFERGCLAQEENQAAQAGQQIAQWRARLSNRRSLLDWLKDLREVCAECGLLARLEQDAAGRAVLAGLHLDDPGVLVHAHADLAGQRLSLADFTAWCRAVLEEGSFVPLRAEAAPSEPVVSLVPLSQVLGRCWDALVIPGCDEQHLPWCPTDVHPWTRAQRHKLGLSTDAARILMQRKSWEQALMVKRVDVLRRLHDQGEEIAASPLLRCSLHALREAGVVWQVRSMGLMERESVAAMETSGPAPAWSRTQLDEAGLLQYLTPSAYEDLRRCPYRFHARRLLGLCQEDELTEDADKRDWGNWVHHVLYRFHTQPRTDDGFIEQQLDEAARAVESEMRLDGAAFLPFRMAWPDLRDAYAQWLREWEVRGGQVEGAEVEAGVRIDEAEITLLGRIDRIDRMPAGECAILDYKTESASKSKKRVSDPLEDAQLAFYVLLMELRAVSTGLTAAYLNLPESGETRLGQRRSAIVRWFALPDPLASADRLRQGIVSDVQRLRDGHALRALGDGPVCEHCEVRGLCRRDFWRGA